MSEIKHFVDADIRTGFEEPGFDRRDIAPDNDCAFGQRGFDLAVEKANAAVARLKEVYVREWAPASVSEMYDALDAAGRVAGLPQLYRLAHDLKGQGGTFGFPLLTEIGESICRLSAGRSDASDSEIALLRAHVDAARTIVQLRLEDDGGTVGRALMGDLRAMIRANLH